MIKNYYQPTPKKWRQLGDALLAVSTFVTAQSIVAGNQTVALVAVILGAVGKFLTNFFSE